MGRRSNAKQATLRKVAKARRLAPKHTTLESLAQAVGSSASTLSKHGVSAMRALPGGFQPKDRPARIPEAHLALTLDAPTDAVYDSYERYGEVYIDGENNTGFDTAGYTTEAPHNEPLSVHEIGSGDWSSEDLEAMLDQVTAVLEIDGDWNEERSEICREVQTSSLSLSNRDDRLATHRRAQEMLRDNGPRADDIGPYTTGTPSNEALSIDEIDSGSWDTEELEAMLDQVTEVLEIDGAWNQERSEICRSIQTASLWLSQPDDRRATHGRAQEMLRDNG